MLVHQQKFETNQLYNERGVRYLNPLSYIAVKITKANSLLEGLMYKHTHKNPSLPCKHPHVKYEHLLKSEQNPPY